MTDLLTTEQIAARYQMASKEEAAKWMHKLPCFKVGKRLFVRATDLAEWERRKNIYVLRRAK